MTLRIPQASPLARHKGVGSRMKGQAPGLRRTQRPAPNSAQDTATLFGPYRSEALMRAASAHVSQLDNIHPSLLTGARILADNAPSLGTAAFSNGGFRMTMTPGLRMEHNPQEKNQTACMLWQRYYDRGQIKELSIAGMDFKVAFVSKKDFPAAASVDAAGFYWGHGFLAVLEDLKASPFIAAEDLDLFNRYIAVHELGEMIFDNEMNPHQMATQLELAVAFEEGNIEAYLDFLKKHNYTKYRNIIVNTYAGETAEILEDESIQTELQILSASTVKKAYKLIRNFNRKVKSKLPKQYALECEKLLEQSQETPEITQNLINEVYNTSEKLVRGFEEAASQVVAFLKTQPNPMSLSDDAIKQAQSLFLDSLAELYDSFQQEYKEWKHVLPEVYSSLLNSLIQTQPQIDLQSVLTPFKDIHLRRLLKIAGWFHLESQNPGDEDIAGLDTSDPIKIKLAVLNKIEDDLQQQGTTWEIAAIRYLVGDAEEFHDDVQGAITSHPFPNIRQQYTFDSKEGFSAFGKGLLIEFYAKHAQKEIDSLLDIDLNQSIQTVWNHILEQNQYSPNTANLPAPIDAAELRQTLIQRDLSFIKGPDAKFPFGIDYKDYLDWVNHNFETQPQIITGVKKWIGNRLKNLSTSDRNTVTIEDLDVLETLNLLRPQVIETLINELITEETLIQAGVLPSPTAAKALGLFKPEICRAFSVASISNLLRVCKSEKVYQIIRSRMMEVTGFEYPKTQAGFLEEQQKINENQQLKQTLKLAEFFYNFEFRPNATPSDATPKFVQKLSLPESQSKDVATQIVFTTLLKEMKDILAEYCAGYFGPFSIPLDQSVALLNSLLEISQKQMEDDLQKVAGNPYVAEVVASEDWKTFSFTDFAKHLPNPSYSPLRDIEKPLDKALSLLVRYSGPQFSFAHYKLKPKDLEWVKQTPYTILHKAWKMLDDARDTEVGIETFFYSRNKITSPQTTLGNLEQRVTSVKGLLRWTRKDIRLRRLLTTQQTKTPDFYVFAMLYESDWQAALNAFATLIDERSNFSIVDTQKDRDFFYSALAHLGQLLTTDDAKASFEAVLKKNRTLVSSEKSRLKGQIFPED